MTLRAAPRDALIAAYVDPAAMALLIALARERASAGRGAD
jgi:hypothetical protein